MTKLGSFVATLASAVAASNLTYSEKVYSFTNVSAYQSGFDSKTGYLYLSATSNIIKFDVNSFEPVDYATPYTSNGSVYSAFGIHIDDVSSEDAVWVTNGKQSTIAKYSPDDLSLDHQFPAKSLAAAARDVSFYESNIYAGTGDGTIEVFDTQTYEKKDTINLNSTGEFGIVMESVVDEDAGVLYTVSISPTNAAGVDLKNGNKVTFYDLGDDAERPSAVAYDSSRSHLFVVSQQSNYTVVVDTQSGKVVKNIDTGATGLSAIYDPTYDLVYFASRNQGVTVVIDADTLEVVDKLNSGAHSNHVALGNDGTLYVVVHNSSPPSEVHQYTPKVAANASSSVGVSSSAIATTSKSAASSSLAASSVPTSGAAGSSNSTATSEGAGSSAAATSVTVSSTAKSANGTAPETTVSAEVTYFTTYCPSPTTFAYGSSTYTVTAATTLTIEDCSCTKTESGSVSAAVTSGNATTSAPAVASASTSAPAVANAANSLTLGAAAACLAFLSQLI